MNKVLKLGRMWWPTFIVLSAILWLTLAPHPVGDTEIELFPGADKLVHAIMMGGLAFTMLFDYARRGEWRYRRTINIYSAATVALICTAFSCVDEWAQGAMEMGRSTDPLDLAADIAGIITATLIAPPSIRKLLPRC